jgi:hypothetical protein
MEHRVHIVGLDRPVKITEEQERQIRNIIIGANPATSYISLGNEKRTLLVRTSGVVALESRPKGSSELSWSVARQG